MQFGKREISGGIKAGTMTYVRRKKYKKQGCI